MSTSDRFDLAVQEVLAARGGVPVPDGITVAVLLEDDTLYWVPGSPFPERCMEFRTVPMDEEQA